MKKRFVVFRCPVCGKFTYAPLGQKTRLCSFCGKIIRIDARHAIVTDDAKQASLLVKRYNLKGGEKNYLEALKSQKEKLLNLIEERKYLPESLLEGRTTVSSSKAGRMFSMLKENCIDPINIDELKELCKKYNLEWDWVREQLEILAREGTVIFPKPWLLQYISNENVEGYVPGRKTSQKRNSLYHMRNLRKVLTSILRERIEPISYAELVETLKLKGFTLTEIEEAVQRLSMEGLLMEPRPGYFLWAGDR